MILNKRHWTDSTLLDDYKPKNYLVHQVDKTKDSIKALFLTPVGYHPRDIYKQLNDLLTEEKGGVS